ncbi:hypothetical protein BU24DRAFT_419049 [Aaosphaeria arxii CBS 175.79]|uniref:Uncharacterized protein n=1 Tax=Aaosphaeria arxii CBS 175.79 TaxID=1450172 RepID=A0A6A5Y2F5_9PLEO|nr:uncharacterized protein BU24DRAFT_419049 [Aaosphaeria arxii CBS 175.79]KAF2019429.1 hypothetical protein BU24DRAFT_419049 [Aaosphaeria arxii CBS 175.79]
MKLTLSLLPLAFLPLSTFGQGISDDDGYSGYKLDIRQDNDPLAVVYETENTNNNVSSSVPEPDVFLNASVHVGEINIEVQNLTAKINLDAQVLQLLQFNAGVDLSIDRVFLLIQNVTAKVLLEARLANLVLMINDTLNSIDLNPIIAELGSGLGTIINETGELIGGLEAEEATAKNKRGIDLMQFQLESNILYSVNDYSGNTHTNRILAQNGDIVEQTLDNNGRIQATRNVGSYLQDMRFNGFNQTVTYKGQEVWEEEYVYEPFPGLMAISGIFLDKDSGEVVGAQLLAEARGGGSSSISASEELKS